jgi:hypothetical protein
VTSDKTDISVTSARNFAAKKLASDVNISTLSNQNVEITSQYLINVGWMIKLSERRFQMLFSDGVHVSIDAKEQILQYKDIDCSETQR